MKQEPEKMFGYKFQFIILALTCGIMAIVLNEIAIAINRTPAISPISSASFVSSFLSAASMAILIIPLIGVILALNLPEKKKVEK